MMMFQSVGYRERGKNFGAAGGRGRCPRGQEKRTSRTFVLCSEKCEHHHILFIKIERRREESCKINDLAVRAGQSFDKGVKIKDI